MQNSLTFRVITAILLSTLALSVLATVLVASSFWRDIEQQQMTSLEMYISERTSRSDDLFVEIRQAHETARTALERRLGTLPAEELNEEFDRLFPVREDGTRRSIDALFDGYTDPHGNFHHGVAAFMSSNEPLDLERKRLLLAAYNVVDQGGEMLAGHIENLYLFTPQNELVISAANRPGRLMFYREEAAADFNLAAASFAQLVLPEANPDGRFVCDELSQAVFIQNRETLTTGCFTPIRMNEVHLGAFGTTIPLQTHFQEAMTDTHANGQNIFINRAGQLIAHRDLLDGEVTEESVTALSEALGVADIHAVIEADGRNAGSVVSTDGRWLIGYARMSGPDWNFVTLLDRGAMQSAAILETGVFLGMAILGVAAQAVVLFWLFRSQIVLPLASLNRRFASRRSNPDREHEDITGIVGQADEIGTLARTLLHQDNSNQRLLDELEDRVEERTRDLEKANRAKSEFIANMSHELRTPLNGIYGLAQAMEASSDSPEQKEQARMIQASGETLTLLLSDILDMSKIEAGHLELAPTSADLPQLIHDCHALFAAQAEDKGIEYTLDIDNMVPVTATVDTHRVRQCLSNLLSNALKFTETGRVALRVSANRTGEFHQIRAEVEDTGIGMDKDVLEKLFSPFQQADASISTRFGGTGLGLVISRNLARLMSGDIHAHSRPAQGSTFIFEFRVSAASSSTIDRPVLNPAEVAADPVYADLKDLRVLLVEDNLVNREVARAFLKSLTGSIDDAHNGEEALNALAEHEYDLVLMDMRMPVMDGLEATRQIRQLATPMCELPIVALTANASQEDARNCLESGMDAFAAKPLRAADFYDAMLRALRVARDRTSGGQAEASG